MVGVYAITTESVYSSLTDFVGRKFAHEVSVVSIVGAAYSNIGFAATPDNIEIVDLHEAFAAGRRKAEHNLA